MTVFGTRSHIGEVVRRVRHRFRTTSNDDISVPRHDRLGTEDDSLEPGGAHLVNGSANGGFRETCTQGALSGGVLADTVQIWRLDD